MTPQPVEAVWIWGFSKAAQKATYGRLAGNGFTKDYLQVSGVCGELMGRMFPFAANADECTLTYKWPEASAEGSLRHPNDRFHLRWKTTSGAPPPWKMTPEPSEAGPQTIPGDPSKESETDALTALEEYESLGISSFLVAVKLVGEKDTLHIRAYIEDPPDGLKFASTAFLPDELRPLLSEVGRGCASIEMSTDGGVSSPAITRLIRELRENPNVLLVGPPGTGKSVLLEQLAQHVVSPGKDLFFDPSKNHNCWPTQSSLIPPGKSQTVVLHPSYSYSDLVIGLLPVPKEAGVAVDVTTGPLVNLAHYASHGGNRALLVLDEFNRGNAAAILGDTLALLDKDKRGSVFIDLAYGRLPIEVPTDYAPDGDVAVGARLTLPPNLWLVAAMNSSDRSVAPLDAALRRRFSIIEMMPDYELLATHLKADMDADLELPWSDWTPEAVRKLAVEVLRSLNERIEAVIGRDFTLGHSHLWHVTGDSEDDCLDALAHAWDTKITQTLRMSLQDDDDALAVILRAGDPAESTPGHEWRVARWRKPNQALGAYANARLEFSQLSGFDRTKLLAELLRQCGD